MLTAIEDAPVKTVTVYRLAAGGLVRAAAAPVSGARQVVVTIMVHWSIHT